MHKQSRWTSMFLIGNASIWIYFGACPYAVALFLTGTHIQLGEVGKMFIFRSALVVYLFMVVATHTFAAEFPDAPANQKEAEAKGLQRVSTNELKKFMPGIIMSLSYKDRKHKLTFNTDGSVDRTGMRAKESTGKWHFDEKINGYCLAFQERKGYQETCFATFYAPDGIHFFDYDIDTGFYAHVWRPAKTRNE